MLYDSIRLDPIREGSGSLSVGVRWLVSSLELTPLAATCKWVKAAGEQLESDEEEDYEDDDEAAGLSAPKPRPTPKAPTTIFVDKDGSYRVNDDRS